MTGGRLKRLKNIIGDETFLLTYGDGLSNVNLSKLVRFHNKNKKLITLTAVRPPARFCAIKIAGNRVKTFKEKSKLDEGWINGGFFVMNSKFLDFIKKDTTFLEKEPLERASKKKQLIAYKHYGFWQCMDTKRDKELLEKTIKKRNIKSEKKLLITGGTGFLGTNLVKSLDLKKYKITVLSKNKKTKNKLKKMLSIFFVTLQKRRI